MNPLNAKKFSYLRTQAFILRSTGLSVKDIAKKLEKSERWVVKWSSRNEGFEDKKRTGRGNSTRQLSQQLASKGLVGVQNTVWKFMKNEDWRLSLIHI